MKNLTIIFSLLLLASCGMNQKQIKKVSVAPQASAYFSKFQQNYGKKIDDIEIKFAEIEQTSILGYCQQGVRYVDKLTVREMYKTPQIVLDITHWNKMTVKDREQLVNHELGHCILGRPHLDASVNGRPVSIMSTYHFQLGVVGGYYESYYSSYISELFTRNTTSTAFAGVTFNGATYASTIEEHNEVDEFVDERDVEIISAPELKDCVHDKGVEVIDEKHEHEHNEQE